MGEETKVGRKKKRLRRSKCQHYWIIDAPDGPTSKGVCKHCGATREFANYWPYSTWERETAKAVELPVLRNLKSRDPDDS